MDRSLQVLTLGLYIYYWSSLPWQTRHVSPDVSILDEVLDLQSGLLEAGDLLRMVHAHDGQDCKVAFHRPL